jgi:chromosome segregation ATPase
MKATQIEAIIEKLNSCFTTATAAKGQLEGLQKRVRLYESDIEIIKEKHTRLQSVSTLRKKIEDTNNEIAWIQVASFDLEVDAARNSLDKKDGEVRHIEDIISNKAKYEKERRNKIIENATTFQTYEEDMKEISARRDEARKEYDAENNKLSEFENVLKQTTEKLDQRILPNIIQLEKDIADVDNNPNNINKLRQENEAKISELEKKKNDLELVLTTCKRDFHAFVQSQNDSQTEQQRLRENLKREQDKIIKIENNISQYKNASKDKLSAYGNSMSQLLQEIKHLYKQKRFSEMPRGPIGSYIEVPDANYRQVVENILGNLLTSFVVNNDNDRQLLVKTKQKYQQLVQIQIITTEFIHEVFDVRNGMVQLKTEGEVLINLLKVSDPVVMNVLIDQRKIENIVLVNDSRLAVHLTQNHENVPHNLLRVVLLEPYSDYYPAPNYRSYSNRKRPSRFIQANFKELVDSMTHDKIQQEEKCRALRAKMSEISNQEREFTKMINDKRSMMSELKRKEDDYIRSLSELRSIEFIENNDIEYLREQLAEQNERKATMEQKMEQAASKFNTLKEIVKTKKEALDQAMEESTKKRANMRIVQNRMDEAQRELNIMKSEIETKGRQISVLKDEQRAAKEHLAALRERLAAMISKIKGPKVQSKHTEQFLLQSIRTAENRIKTIESSKETIEEVELLLNNKTQQVEDTKKIYATFQSVLHKVSESLRQTFETDSKYLCSPLAGISPRKSLHLRT